LTSEFNADKKFPFREIKRKSILRCMSYEY
jgi:hypothetical protein